MAECKACEGIGLVCDSCGGHFHCWVTCKDCGRDFCSGYPSDVGTCWEKHRLTTGHKAQTA
jgi:hypothetical protein